MKRLALFLALFILVSQAHAQKLSGQWTGGFNSGGSDIFGRTEYVLELEVKGTQVTGYSYTYFSGYDKRYYVICRLTGSFDKASKSVVVKEVEKVKSNTPPDFNDCLQTHTLTYMKDKENKEILVGKWKPAKPGENCGSGQTELERKALVRVIPKSTTPPVAAKPAPKTNTAAPKTTSPSTAKTTTKPATNTTTKPAAPPVAKKATPPPPAKTTTPPVTNTYSKPETIDKNVPSIEKPKAPSMISQPNSKLEMRSKQLIRTVEVDSKSFRVDLYDNGQIDGDTISVFFNGKLMVSRQRLSTEPITINLSIDPTRNDNELVMYAENLGTIPPNTALMVVTVEGKRYEVNISSSEQTSGTVKFKLREQ